MNFSPAIFFAECGKGVMGPTLNQNEVDGANAILGALEGLPISWVAYALATVWHETAHTMQPIGEYGGDAYFTRMYDIRGRRPKTAERHGNTRPGDGPLFKGRGYVQLTWANNYKKAGNKIGVDLYSNPELALREDIAAKIMRFGMVEGWFTSRSFESYLPMSGCATRQQFKSARRIINGVDKASLIAGYALEFQEALQASGWQSNVAARRGPPDPP